MSDFDKEFAYTRAKIKMSNPIFFGVTNQQAEEYKKIIQEREQDLYNPAINATTKSDITEDDIVDVEYYEVIEPYMLSCKS